MAREHRVSADRAALAGLEDVLTCTGPTCGDTIDWSSCAISFPADYRAFVTAFGDGSIEDIISILVPDVASAQPHAATLARMSDAAAEWEDPLGWEYEWAPADRGRYERADLLIWGGTCTGDTLCWVTTDPDPDRWPVAVYARGRLEWAVYPCGMAEFLVKLLRNEWPRNPISDDSFENIVAPRFQHEKDESAAYAVGVDPWEPSEAT
ncbi:hypothetical protein LTV02_13400 [Nocardia yamanashiensis]|uniref:hypothetical protein n=1 Tax=Nocardia yamanashiensis TaxID=209247 RepID=UPI001E39B964|nr:hypothetical protein [Nocardia yamanashiensis]UGT44323.1 hypothetical protein LTV02_13400 [Nocardia yamanashiensis]